MQFRLFASLALLTAVSSILPACVPLQEEAAATSANTSVQTGVLVPTPDVSATADSAVPTKSDRIKDVELTVANLEQLSEIVKSQAGKVVVVDIWSTSCAPCMLEFPHLVALSQTASNDLACISLNVDYIGLKSRPPESLRTKVEEFLQRQQADQVTNLLSASTDQAVLGEFQLASIPAILIYSADGALQHALTDANTGDDGLSYEGDVIAKVNALLAEK
ncbi:MAG: TlpA disulfide reductase family protein [Aureliella sp.]